MIPPIRQQIIRNRSNYYCTNRNSMMTRCNPGRNILRITHKNTNKRITVGNNSVHCLLELRSNSLNILNYNFIKEQYTVPEGDRVIETCRRVLNGLM